ncbi:MAG: alpha/beta hydrolase [Patescibacteria group bacterium]|nr:alpha/beta hydrolase [Patescibacteria group bacterium]
MKNKIQIILIHGGTTFKNYKDYENFLKTRKITIKKRIDWKDDYFNNSLGRNFEIIKPKMPLKDNAKYNEWKIHFERYFPFIRDNVILIGTSLGGIFLAKYLSENNFPKKILSIYLICPPFDNTLINENLVGGFKLKSSLSNIEKNCKNIILLFSKNDNVVPISHADKYKKLLKNTKIIIYKNKNGHFKIQKFPELIKMLKADLQHKIKNNK